MTRSFKVAPLDHFPEGRGMRVEIGEHRIAMFRVDDVVYAIGDRCSHAEASLSEGEVFDGEVECPRHGSAFDLATGAPQTLPATRPVPVYAVEVVEGDVYVTVEDVVSQEVAG